MNQVKKDSNVPSILSAPYHTNLNLVSWCCWKHLLWPHGQSCEQFVKNQASKCCKAFVALKGFHMKEMKAKLCDLPIFPLVARDTTVICTLSTFSICMKLLLVVLCTPMIDLSESPPSKRCLTLFLTARKATLDGVYVSNDSKFLSQETLIWTSLGW